MRQQVQLELENSDNPSSFCQEHSTLSFQHFEALISESTRDFHLRWKAPQASAKDFKRWDSSALHRVSNQGLSSPFESEPNQSLSESEITCSTDTREHVESITVGARLPKVESQKGQCWQIGAVHCRVHSAQIRQS